MTASWTITEGAVWDWTWSIHIDEGADPLPERTESGNSSVFAQTTIGGTPVQFTQTDTGTYYTSTIVSSETTIRTTTQAFDEEEFIYETRLSASYDTAQSTIVTFGVNTSSTRTTAAITQSSVLTTASAGTYLKPIEYPGWVDVYEESWFAPTVYAWSSREGFIQPDASIGASSLPSAATLLHSGQTTVYPRTEVFQKTYTSNPGGTDTTDVWQSDALTWTQPIVTGTKKTMTQAIGGGASPITRGTQTYTKIVNSTETQSSLFRSSTVYIEYNANNLFTYVLHWPSTTLTQQTYLVESSTETGQSTTTVLATAVGRENFGFLGADQSAQLPVALYVLDSTLRGDLRYGSYSQYYTHNAGYALDTSSPGKAALSHADSSFPLPAQSFQTVSLQPGLTAPRPFQTRSQTSSNSTTSWSLGFSALSITTSSTNSTTGSSTTSSYALSAADPTLWSESYKALDQTQTAAAGGHYPTSALFVGGGLFTATQGASEFTGTALTLDTEVTAIQPLPHFIPIVGAQGIQTVSLATSAAQVNYLGISTIGAPLTA